MLLLTVYGSLIPFQFQPRPLDEAVALFREMPAFQPSLLEPRGDWVVSVVQFLTLSYLAMAALSVDHTWDIGVGAAILVVPACVLLSLVLEFLQVYFPPRTVSVNDVVVESLGGLAGAGAWLAGGQRLTNWLRRLGTSRGIDRFAARLLPGYFALLLVLELMPFDLIVSGAELRVKFQEGKVRLLPFYYPEVGVAEWFGKAVWNMAGFLPLGFLQAVVSGPVPTSRRPWLRVAFFGAAAAALVQFLKLFVFSRYCDLTDVVTGAAAVLGGWYLGRACRHRGPSWGQGIAVRPLPTALWTAAFLTWLGVVLAVNWWPFDFTAEPTRFAAHSEDREFSGLRRLSWLPFVDYYWGSKYNALDQFTRKALSFVPLGVLFALRRGAARQPGAGVRVVVTALLVAGAVEAGRYFLPARSPSVTDLFIQGAGAWAGFAVSRYVRGLLENEWALQGRKREFCS
jgi:VanZ family protein